MHCYPYILWVRISQNVVQRPFESNYQGGFFKMQILRYNSNLAKMLISGDVWGWSVEICIHYKHVLHITVDVQLMENHHSRGGQSPSSFHFLSGPWDGFSLCELPLIHSPFSAMICALGAWPTWTVSPRLPCQLAVGWVQLVGGPHRNLQGRGKTSWGFPPPVSSLFGSAPFHNLSWHWAAPEVCWNQFILAWHLFPALCLVISHQ